MTTLGVTAAETGGWVPVMSSRPGIDDNCTHKHGATHYTLSHTCIHLNHCSERCVLQQMVSWCYWLVVDGSVMYYTTEYSHLMTTFQCPSDILITSWLFTAQWSTWPGNHLVPCVAELVGSCIPIHARRCLPDPKCLFYPSGLSLTFSVNHFCLVPVDDMEVGWWHGGRSMTWRSVDDMEVGRWHGGRLMTWRSVDISKMWYITHIYNIGIALYWCLRYCFFHMFIWSYQ